MRVDGRRLGAFGLAAAAALAGQTLLIAESQCRRLENALGDDFRVVFFLRGSLDEPSRLVLEEKLRAQPETQDVRYVSPEEGLARLKREDPELVDSIALVGENPLPGAFEVRPAPQALPRLAAWINSVQEASWSDVRWKGAQLQALLRARMYGHWLRLVLSTLFCAVAALALWALYASLIAPVRDRRLPLFGGLGGVVGLTVAGLAAWPLRKDASLWAWPGIWTQALLVAACASLGWSLSSGWLKDK